MNLKIITMHDSRLRQQSCDLTVENLNQYKNEINDLSNHMVNLVKSRNAAGIASIQIEDDIAFDFLQTNDKQRKQPSIIVINSDLNYEVMINPKITKFSGKMIDSQEGCLSIPNIDAVIKRDKEIEVEYYDLNFNLIQIKACDFKSIVIQHEIDHLKGVLYPDHLSNYIKKEIFWKNYNARKNNFK